ncbi:fumarylacetoacetate hydrolase family protein [Microbacterium yannicii]|uniref:Fumarylacetoacetate hydrolase family protein n=1 Tax=Microbacterium yannicii TaxID=671622 RepID=A0ABP9MCV9_9MICO|nr:fumarylacetoacetate hydrolase family protein [Microbacterium yannicii]MCO5952443.1 fumarylacetoacetate hydrolase family protein [Microbacterium yannicii]
MTPNVTTAVAPEAFGLGTFAASGQTFVGMLRDGVVHDTRPVLGRDATIRSLLQDWDAAIDTLIEVAPSLTSGISLEALEVLPPVQPAGQILCAGANYRVHVEQIVQSTLRNAGDPRSDEELHAFALETVERQAQTDPFMFVGLPSAVSGAHDDVILWTPGEQHDWELELGVILKTAAHRISPEESFDNIAGYVMSNDITVRDVMSRSNVPLTDFVTSKNRPTYFPTGPVILPSRFVSDYRRLRITLKVNGETMQDELVADIIHGVEKCVSYASHSARLSAGDMILTGSPAGNAGKHGNRWLRPGDVMEASITGLGTQVTRCVAPPQ